MGNLADGHPDRIRRLDVGGRVQFQPLLDVLLQVLTTRTTSAGADVEEGIQVDAVVAEVVDDDRVSFQLEVTLNIVLDWQVNLFKQEGGDI